MRTLFNKENVRMREKSEPCRFRRGLHISVLKLSAAICTLVVAGHYAHGKPKCIQAVHDSTRLKVDCKQILPSQVSISTKEERFESPWITSLLDLAEKSPDPISVHAIRRVRANPKEFRFQLLIRPVFRVGSKLAAPTEYAYRVDQEYLYPASAIKIFGVLGVLMSWTLHKKKLPWLDLKLPLSLGKHPPNKKCHLTNWCPTLLGHIRRTLVVSSNVDFNKLLDVVGLKEMAPLLTPHFPSLRVSHYLYDQSSTGTRAPSQVHVLNPLDNESHILPRRTNEAYSGETNRSFCHAPRSSVGANPSSLHVGRAHLAPDSGTKISRPMNFTNKNRVSLYDLQRAMAATNGVTIPHEQCSAFELHTFIEADWLARLKHLTRERPSDLQRPVLDPDIYIDSRFKPMLPGLARSGWSNRELIYSNKGGGAYGFVIENAFVALAKPGTEPDSKRCVGFLLSGGVYANENGVINDNQYQYSTISKPVLSGIGYALGMLLKEPGCGLEKVAN
jgi:hypothetical protein